MRYLRKLNCILAAICILLGSLWQAEKPCELLSKVSLLGTAVPQNGYITDVGMPYREDALTEPFAGRGTIEKQEESSHRNSAQPSENRSCLCGTNSEHWN